MERFDYFKTIEDKYKNRYSTKRPLVVRLDGKGVTKNKYINLMSLKEDSFRYALNETAKIISERYHCIAYVHCDEMSFIFEEPEFLKLKYDSVDIQKINSLFSQEVFYVFNELFEEVQTIYFDCRCYNIPSHKIDSYLKYRVKSSYNTIHHYIYKKYLPKHKQKDKHQMSLEELVEVLKSDLEFYTEYNEIQLYGALFSSGEPLNIDEYKFKDK